MLSSPDRVSRRRAAEKLLHAGGQELSLLEVGDGLYAEGRLRDGYGQKKKRTARAVGKHRSAREKREAKEGGAFRVDGGDTATGGGGVVGRSRPSRPHGVQREASPRGSPRRQQRTSPSRPSRSPGRAGGTTQRAGANPQLEVSAASMGLSPAGRPSAELAGRERMFQVAAPRDESELELASPLRAGNGLTALQVAAVEDTFGAMNAAVTALQGEWELGRQEVQERLAETVGEKVRLRAEVESLKAEHAHMIDDMRQMRVSCTAAVKEQQADKGAAWVRAVAANEALAASSQQMSALKSENTELREMLVGLARNLQQHRDASEAEGKERRNLQRQLQKLEQQNADEALRFVDFDNSLDAALTECARHKARAEAMDEKCAKYDAMDTRCERLGTKNRQLESEIVRLSTENARLIEESTRNAQELASYKQKEGQQALVQWAKETARMTEATPKNRQTSSQEQLLVQWAKANAPQYPKPRRIQVRAADLTQLPMP